MQVTEPIYKLLHNSTQYSIWNIIHKVANNILFIIINHLTYNQWEQDKFGWRKLLNNFTLKFVAQKYCSIVTRWVIVPNVTKTISVSILPGKSTTKACVCLHLALSFAVPKTCLCLVPILSSPMEMFFPTCVLPISSICACLCLLQPTPPNNISIFLYATITN